MPKKRVNRITSSTIIPQVVFSEGSNSYKVSESGLALVTNLGTLGTAQQCGPNTPVYVQNSAAAVGYVAFGTTNGVAAPTGLSNGIMIPAGGVVVLSSGSNSWIIGSAATIGAWIPNEGISDAPDQASVTQFQGHVGNP